MDNETIGYKKRIKQLIRDIETDRVVIPLKLGLICESVKSRILERLPKEKAARIAIGEMPGLRANSGQMELLLFLLLDNALEGSREGVPPIIAVFSECVSACLRIRVQDNGAGLPLTGLDGTALAAAQRLVADYDGRLLMEYRPGCGTVAIAELPWTDKLQKSREEA
jgi:C4-dicarboxylate-specific signal transduction histidine kinase